MKNIILLIGLLFAIGASAHTITGTPVLKGTLKSKLMVDGVKSTCKVQIEKIWSTNNEDSFGNPGYMVRMDLSLSGNDIDTGKTVKVDQKLMLTNMFVNGTSSTVKDYEYLSEDKKVTLTIKTDGRLNTVAFPYKTQKVTCAF